jgi:hypothetical protein
MTFNLFIRGVVDELVLLVQLLVDHVRLGWFDDCFSERHNYGVKQIFNLSF